MEIIFYGGAQTVTGSCFVLLTDTGEKIMVDCGLFQGSKAIKERNYGDFPFDPKEIDWVLLTHAHIDHCGRIPKLYKHGYKGPVIATGVTKDLCSVMLPDSGYIQETEVERKNRKNLRAGRPLIEPIYTAAEAEACIDFFQGIDYGELVKLNDNVTIRNDPDVLEDTDYLVLESTYGSRNHEIEDEETRLKELATVVEETFEAGGNLIIPSFAVERTQDLLYDLNRLVEAGKIQPENIFVDSPLAIAVTEIFCQNIDTSDQDTQDFSRRLGRCPLIIKNLKFTRTAEESMEINKIKSGAIVISASGMCDFGRIKHHLKHNLWRENSTVLFIGYQAEGSLGRYILEGAPKVRIHGEEVSVNARVENISGYSSHSDQKNILNWIGGITHKPELIFLVHGEVEESCALKALIEKEHHIETYIPHFLEEYPLIKAAKLAKAHEYSRGYELELMAQLESLVRELQQTGQELILAKRVKEAEKLFDEIKRKIS